MPPQIDRVGRCPPIPRGNRLDPDAGDRRRLRRKPPADKLPTAIGSRRLRAAAAKGDPAAQFEIASRFADGRGVPQDLLAASDWFERAAKQGLAPAQFRLGGFL